MAKQNENKTALSPLELSCKRASITAFCLVPFLYIFRENHHVSLLWIIVFVVFMWCTAQGLSLYFAKQVIGKFKAKPLPLEVDIHQEIVNGLNIKERNIHNLSKFEVDAIVNAFKVHIQREVKRNLDNNNKVNIETLHRYFFHVLMYSFMAVFIFVLMFLLNVPLRSLFTYLITGNCVAG